MESKNIFIHIPKTGGTTINCAMNKTAWQTQPNFNYRHIIYETKCSNSADIFDAAQNDQFLAYTLFMIIRNPVDRLLSEYYFLKDRKEFMRLIKPTPRNLKEYIKSRQTQNYMLGFVLGKRIFDKQPVTEKDYETVIAAIEKLDIHVGLFERYPETMEYLGTVSGISWPKKIDVKRITLNRPKLEEVDEETKELIRKHNALDQKLYDYCAQRFETKTADIKFKHKISFHANKYDYVIKYTQRFNLLELGLNDKTFIQAQQHFFKDLNEHLHHTLRISDGKAYVVNWNQHFIKQLIKKIPDSPLANDLNALANEDPLEKTMAICKVLNEHFTRRMLMLFSREKMIFDPANFDLLELPKKAEKSFLKRLFGR